MKRVTLILTALIAMLNLSAADIIVLKNSTRIDAKILEVSDTEIKYKKISSQDGPIFIQKVDGISAIIYENGEVQSFGEQNNVQNDAQSSAQNGNEQQQNTSAQTSAQKQSKITFNPQPSDNYIFGLTFGYVSKQAVANKDGYTLKGSMVLGQEKKVSPAMRFGLTANPTFKYGIGLRTGLYFEYVYEVAKGITDNHGDYVAHDITFSLPIQASYRYELIPDLSFMFYTGPVFDFGAYCVAGVKGERMSSNIYSYKSKYSGFNCLWGIGAGIQWKMLRLDVGGEFGMVNKLEGEKASRTSFWNKPVYVTLTYFF